MLETVKVLESFIIVVFFVHLGTWSAMIVEVGKFKTQIDAPLSSKNKSFYLDGKEMSSGASKNLGIKKPSGEIYGISMIN